METLSKISNSLSTEEILLILIIGAVISIFFNVALKSAGIPPALGYIFSGIIITIIFDLKRYQAQGLHDVAEFGIVFMLFTLGIEFSLENLRRMFKEVAIHGTLQFAITSLVFYLLSHFVLGMSQRGSIITGFSVALSSTAIVLKFINDKRDTGRTYAREAIGILIFQDIAVIFILIMVTVFSDQGTSVINLLALTGLHAVIVLSLLFIIGYFVLNRFFSWITGTHSHEIFIASVLMLVVGSSYIAHFFGFTYSLGAFIAGLMISETHYKYQVEADLTPFRDLLLGVFFVSVGMQVDIQYFQENIGKIFLMVAAIMIIKAVILYGILKFSHWHITSLKAAISLSQVGEFSFVIFEMASNHDLVSKSFSQEMILVVTISMIVTPFILNYQDKFFKIFRQMNKVEEPGFFSDFPELQVNHILVIGYGYHGRRVVEHLEEKQIPYIVVEFRRELVDRGRRAAHNVVFGNAAQKSILKKAGINSAMAAIIAIEDEKHAVLIAKRIAEIGEHINVVVKSTTDGPFKVLEKSPGLMVINEQEEIARTLIHYALSCDIK